MSLCLISTRPDGAVIASDDAVALLRPGGGFQKLPRRLPKFFVLAPDLLLAVTGREPFAVVALALMTRVVRACRPSDVFPETAARFAASVASWHKEIEDLVRHFEDTELSSGLALVGIDRSRGCVRLMSWGSEEGLVEWSSNDATFCMGCPDAVAPAAEGYCRAVRSAPSLSGVEAVMRELVSTTSRADWRVGSGVWSYKLPLVGAAEGTLPNGAGCASRQFGEILASHCPDLNATWLAVVDLLYKEAGRA